MPTSHLSPLSFSLSLPLFIYLTPQPFCLFPVSHFSCSQKPVSPSPFHFLRSFSLNKKTLFLNLKKENLHSNFVAWHLSLSSHFFLNYKSFWGTSFNSVMLCITHKFIPPCITKFHSSMFSIITNSIHQIFVQLHANNSCQKLSFSSMCQGLPFVYLIHYVVSSCLYFIFLLTVYCSRKDNYQRGV